ncbi:MAG TPA: amidase [Chloroflexota bacterium]|nr:amidase [Chloroflexota bacterium]
MTADELAFATIAELAPRLRRRELSPVELVDTVLDRIARLDPLLNAFITVTDEEARRAAQQAEEEILHGTYRGPLHGIPISLKDLYLTAGVRTTGGSRILADYIPREDATVTRRLREAGAILIGKTNLHEFAYGTTTINPHFGTTRNPWNLDRITAGSSGGSAAAVAAGLGVASMGSETGWSIRRPAAFCGVVGLKPTYGRVSRYGMLPAAWSLDHAGPLTRSVSDAALVLSAIAGPDPRDPATATRPVPDFSADLAGGIRGLRIGLPIHHYAGSLDPAVELAIEQAVKVFSALGAVVREISLPRARYAGIASSVIMSAEVTAAHERWLRERPADYGSDVRERIEAGLAISAGDYLRAQRLRRWIAEEMAEVLHTVDVLVCPTTPQVATPIAGGVAALHDPPPTVAEGPFNLLRLFALIGTPAISVPCGFSDDGLPVGLTVAGRAFDEATVLRVAWAYEQATGWGKQRPPAL